MKPHLVVTAAAILVLVSIAYSKPGQDSDSELNRGIEAYKQSHYDEAIQHFRKAVEAGPNKPIARLYLATALTSQYIPGVDTPDNIRLAEQAIEQYEQVLNSGAELQQKINSAKGIGYLALNMKKFDDAKWYYQKASGLDANDPDPYYSIGTIDWMQCYQPRQEARARLGVMPDKSLSAAIPAQRKACADLKAQNSLIIEDGIDNLNKAIELKPDYDDAMAYLNLMYRERADLECDDPGARARDLKTADHWVDRTLMAKKAKADRAATALAPPPPQ